MGHVLRMWPRVAERFSFYPLVHELAHTHPQRLGEPPKDAERRILQADFQACEVAPADVRLRREAPLAQVAARSQLLQKWCLENCAPTV